MSRGVYKRTKYHCKRMSEGAKNRKITPLFRKARSDNAKINLNYGMRGKKHSEESKEKMSKNCRGKYTKEKNPNWKGGISSENDKARHTFEVSLWKKAVFERDNFTCQKYGIKGGKLVAHHINNFAEFPELRTSIENGITLSEKAHKEFHKKYGRKNNIKEQLEEFLVN